MQSDEKATNGVILGIATCDCGKRVADAPASGITRVFTLIGAGLATTQTGQLLLSLSGSRNQEVAAAS